MVTLGILRSWSQALGSAVRSNMVTMVSLVQMPAR